VATVRKKQSLTVAKLLEKDAFLWYTRGKHTRKEGAYMRNDLTKLQFCKGCHQPFLGPKMVMRQETGNLIHNEYCPDCVQRYQDQVDYMEEGYRQARQERYDQWLQERDNWRMDQFEKRLDEQYRQRQLADEYRASRV
jgi:hypothetical protein